MDHQSVRDSSDFTRCVTVTEIPCILARFGGHGSYWTRSGGLIHDSTIAALVHTEHLVELVIGRHLC